MEIYKCPNCEMISKSDKNIVAKWCPCGYFMEKELGSPI